VRKDGACGERGREEEGGTLAVGGLGVLPTSATQLFFPLSQLADLSSLATTKRLDLAGNKIAALASFVPPPALKHLDLKANALSCFSLSLASLRVLDLSSNRLAGTFHLAGLPALAALILSENKLTGLTGLGSAPELATLVIKHNAFVDLAPALAKGAAKALTKLSAAHNKLTALDVTPCPALAELRAGHNDLSALPTGLGARLRVLDVGGNPRLGGRAAGKKGLAAAVAPLAGKPWLRAVTLRGTALGGCDGIKDALAAVLPDLQILDDKRVAGRGADGALPPPPPPASPSHVKKVKFERKLKEKVEEKKAKVKEKKEKVKEKKAETAAVGRLASEEGLGAAGEDEAPGPAPPAAALPLPLADPTPHGQAAVKVLPGARPSKKGGKGGAAAALLIAGRDEMEVGGWG